MSTRRHFVKSAVGAGLLGGLGGTAMAKPYARHPAPLSEDSFRILHLTDIHLRPEYNAPQRCARLLARALRDSGDIDLVLNGGDSIYAADYRHITRERVLEQWALWDEVVSKPLAAYEMLSALGNHDMWWAGSAGDAMRGKNYVLERLKQESRFFKVERHGWVIAILDCNNAGLLDDEQLRWLHELAAAQPGTPMLIMSHQPIMMAQGLLSGGMSARQREIIDPFVDWRLEARPVYFLSGHEHVFDQADSILKRNTG